MKIPAILITEAALQMILGEPSTTVPATWFNWRLSDGTVSRLTVVRKLKKEVFDQWLKSVKDRGFAAIVLLTSDDDPDAEFYGIDSERDYQSVTVDLLDEVGLWHLRVEIASPESEYLGQWARFALGAGVPFGWLQAHDGLWRAYATALRVWTEEPSARQWLDNLDAVDYTPMSPDLQLKPEEFEIPEQITEAQVRDGYFPSVYNPAFAVGFKNGELATYGIRLSPESEWSFDPSHAIRDYLLALRQAVVG